MDLKDILKQAEGFQSKLQGLEEELTALETIGEAGGGMIEVRLNGKYEIVSLTITDQAHKEDKEVLAELVMTAANNAVTKMHELRQEKQGALLLGGLDNV